MLSKNLKNNLQESQFHNLFYMVVTLGLSCYGKHMH